MCSLIGGILNVNVFLWSDVLEEVERTRILLLTGVSAHEITDFYIWKTAFNAGLTILFIFS